MTSQEKALADFGRWCLLQSREQGGCDLDGGGVQDQAEQLGLLERVTVTEPCGEACVCAEYSSFPQICLRLAAGVQS
ncbi:MAG: hypothetical protein H8K10_02000 [Nitrospira sp.]|nr:hypothetical protein [Nitrospira sp.]